MDTPTDMDSVRDEILLATLPNVVFDGWSEAALRDGAKTAGYDAIMAHRAFFGGAPELVEHFGAWTDRRMAEIMVADPRFSAMRTGEKIKLALRTHFEVLEPHREAKRRMMAFLAMPQNVGAGLQRLYRSVDCMWRLAGDDSTDFNHYTKRALLSAVLSTATFYWLDDQSEGREETWAFIDRRLANVAWIGKTASAKGGLLWLLPNPARFARQLRQHTASPQMGEATERMAEKA